MTKRSGLNRGDPTDWRTMGGETELEKRVNAYLALTFIGAELDVPVDECLNEARHLIKLVQMFERFIYRSQ